jgi:hypothetical protein
VLSVEREGTFKAAKHGAGTSYLRSNGDIRRFGWLLRASRLSSGFQEPMILSTGTNLCQTKDARVAVLPDGSAIVDGGVLGGGLFPSANEYRARTGDREDWKLIRKF